jgi:hypothetical protein
VAPAQSKIRRAIGDGSDSRSRDRFPDSRPPYHGRFPGELLRWESILLGHQPGDPTLGQSFLTASPHLEKERRSFAPAGYLMRIA